MTELAEAGTEPVPGSIRDGVAARLRRCGEAATTLRAAAVLGPDIDLDLLAAVLDVSPLVVLEHLDAGHRHAFLIERNGVTSFRHDVVRDAIVDDTTTVRRTWLHQQAARHLAARPSANALELARHARAAGDEQLAATALAAAADIARTRFDLDGAERLFDEAIALHDGADLRLRRSRCGWPATTSTAPTLTPRPRSVPAPERRRSNCGRGRRATATTPPRRFDSEPLARPRRPTARRGRAACWPWRSPNAGLGDLAAADSTLAVAGEEAPATLGVDGWLGVLRVHQGRAEDALAALQPLIGAEAGGSLSFWVEHVLQMAIQANGFLGHVGNALALLDRMEIELRRRGSDVRYGGVTHNYRSWLLRNLGSPLAEDEARAGVEQAKLAEAGAQARLDLADTLLLLGRHDEAAAGLVDATAAIGGPWFSNRWRAEQRAEVIKARLHLVGGDPASALAVMQGVAELAEARGDARYATIAGSSRRALRLVSVRPSTSRRSSPTSVDSPRWPRWRRGGSLPTWLTTPAWSLPASAAIDAGRRLLAEAGEHAAELQRALDARFT